MGDKKAMTDVDIEIIVEQVISDFKGLILQPAQEPAPSSESADNVDEHTIYIDYEELEDNAIDSEIAMAELNYNLRNLPWRSHDNIAMQIMPLLHEAHVALNVSCDRLEKKLAGNTPQQPQTPGSSAATPATSDYLSCPICSHILELLYEHKVFDAPQRTVNLPVRPIPQKSSPMSDPQSNEAQSDDLNEAQSDDLNEARPSTSRNVEQPSQETPVSDDQQTPLDVDVPLVDSSEPSLAAHHQAPLDVDVPLVDSSQPSLAAQPSHQGAAHDEQADNQNNDNLPNEPQASTSSACDQASSPTTPYLYYHQLMGHGRTRPSTEIHTDMPRAKMAKLSEPAPSYINRPSTSGRRMMTASNDANVRIDSSDDSNDARTSQPEAEQEAEEARPARKKKWRQLHQRKSKK